MTVDLIKFRLKARSALAQLDADTAASVFGEIQSICKELENYRNGAQRRTLDDAEHVAALANELKQLSPAERLAAIRQRTGFGKTKIYKLLGLTSSRPTRIPHPARTAGL